MLLSSSEIQTTPIKLRKSPIFCHFSPESIEKNVISFLPKRSLSPYLYRKIQDNSLTIFQRDRSPSKQDIASKSKLPFIFPDKNRVVNAYKKEYELEVVNVLKNVENAKYKRFTYKITHFKEKLDRLISQNACKIKENQALQLKLKEKAENNKKTYRSHIGYEVNEIDRSFKTLIRKIGSNKKKS